MPWRAAGGGRRAAGGGRRAAGLSAAEQRRLHAAAADAIEALYEGRLDLHLAEVARHRVEASLPGDRAEAVAACAAAADVAAQALAFEEAVRLYRQALAVGAARPPRPARTSGTPGVRVKPATNSV